ncbi:accessory factor associated with RNA polymerase II [Orbilia brochopaga]|uniref:Accessory factor associated with RNA polymerase II n=1 Tax=Orbilia brochopaga TaxID=3140254 RepID=A0AAV9UEB3_9PEZI
MAAAAANDPLQLLRLSIQTSNPPKLSDGPTPSATEPSISTATHIIFTHPATISFTLNTPTRFHTRAGEAFDIRSVLFAWQRRDDGIPAYVAACQSVGNGKLVKNLGFLERTDLITWLEGATDESDFLTRLEGAAAEKIDDRGAGGGAAGIVASGAAVGGAAAGGLGAVAKSRYTTNLRLAEIYSRERVVTDRNTVLRGVKPTDFSHVRKISEAYMKNARAAQQAAAAPKTGEAALPPRPGGNIIVSTKPQGKPPAVSKPRARHPIIILSPSTSALLRMSNIKRFLEEGEFVQPSMSLSDSENMMYISRRLPAINPSHDTRFVIVDSPDYFPPDEWSRVVAVFTTGQQWQFKTYKWSTPQDLFSNVKGFYVGWSGEAPPSTVASWGNVQLVNVEKNRRFKDREVMEGLWDGIETWMVKKGWGARR